MGTIGSWDRTGPCITLVIPAQTNRNLAIITEPTLDSGHLAKFPSYDSRPPAVIDRELPKLPVVAEFWGPGLHNFSNL